MEPQDKTPSKINGGGPSIKKLFEATYDVGIDKPLESNWHIAPETQTEYGSRLEIQNKLSLEKIYTDSESVIVKARHQIDECINLVATAIKASDELERESIMNSFVESIFRLADFIKIDKNLKDLIIHIHVAVIAHLKEIYSRDEMLALKKVLGIMKGNIIMDDATKLDCILQIDKAGFNTNAPFSEANFDEANEE